MLRSEYIPYCCLVKGSSLLYSLLPIVPCTPIACMPPPILGLFSLAGVECISQCVEFGGTFPGIGNKTTYSLYRRTKRGVIESEIGSGAVYHRLGVIAKRYCRPRNRHDLV